MKIKKLFFWYSITFLMLIGLMAIFAPYITPYSYEEQFSADRLQTPSSQHWLGTDALGRDLYSRIVYGARLSLACGIGTAALSLILGTSVGLIAGYKGGKVDELLMGLVDLFHIFPAVLLAIFLTLLLGRGILGIIIALGLTNWLSQARLVRGLVLKTRELPFVEAAKAMGASPSRILFSHILPNLWGTIWVAFSIQVPQAILAESFLSFMGLGLQPPYASWGTLCSEGFRAMQSFPHLIIFPSLFLFLTMHSIEGIRLFFDTQWIIEER